MRGRQAGSSTSTIMRTHPYAPARSGSGQSRWTGLAAWGHFMHEPRARSRYGVIVSVPAGAGLFGFTCGEAAGFADAVGVRMSREDRARSGERP
jgi:hypothetical protein